MNFTTGKDRKMKANAIRAVSLCLRGLLLTILIFVNVATICVLAQPGDSKWERLSVSSEFASLRAVSMSSDTTGIAVGEGGVIQEAYASKPGDGLNGARSVLWRNVQSPTRNRLNALSLTRGGRFVIVGDNGTIMIYDPQTKQLTTISSIVTENMISIDSRGDTIVVGGDQGGVYVSEDQGNTWYIQPSPTRDPVESIAIGSEIYITTAMDVWVLQKSGSWSRIAQLVLMKDVGGFRHLYVRTESNVTSYYLICGMAKVLKSTDGGETWHDILGLVTSIPKNGDLFAFDISPDARRIVTSSYNSELGRINIHLTSDNGATWRNVGLDFVLNEPPSDIDIVDNNIILVGSTGMTLTMSADSRGVYHVPELTQRVSRQRIVSVSVDGENINVVGGYGAMTTELFRCDTSLAVPRTQLRIDGGLDNAGWRYERGSIASNGNMVVASLIRSLGVTESYLVRSTDGGETWREIAIDRQLGDHVNVYSKGETFVVIGNRESPLVSTDNGDTWRHEDYDDDQAVPIPYAWMRTENMWVEAFASRVSPEMRYRITYDRGNSWKEIHEPPFTGLFAITETGRWVVVGSEWQGGYSQLLNIATSDFEGLTWTIVVDGQQSFSSERGTSINTHGQRIIVCDEYGSKLISNDDGTTWQTDNEVSIVLSQPALGSFFYKDGRIAIIGRDGAVVREKRAPVTSVTGEINKVYFVPRVFLSDDGYAIVEAEAQPDVLFVDLVGRSRGVPVANLDKGRWQTTIPFNPVHQFFIVDGQHVTTFVR